MRVKLHQILLRIIMKSVSAQSSHGPWSNPSVTLSKPRLVAPQVRVSLYLSDLVRPGNHHVGSGCSKGVRSCRRFLNPDSKELEPHFSIGFLGTEDVAIDDQLQSFIVDLQTLIAIPVTCCCLSDSPAVRRPQDIHPDQIVNLDPTAFIAFDDVMECNAVSPIQSG